MKRFFSFFGVLMASTALAMTLSLGVVSIVPQVLHAQEVVVVEQQKDVVQLQEIEVVEQVEDHKFCQDEQGQPKACEDADLLKFLIASMGGLKGASALAIAFFISKLLLLLIMSPFFTSVFPSLLKGGVKLLVASGLNLVIGVLSLMLPPVELSFGAALTHSTVLALASVFANQAYKQWLTKKGQS